LNSTREPAEQLRLEEFELDDDIEELEGKECEKDKQIAEIMVTSLIEERDQWASRMKNLMWDDFQVKICKINVRKPISPTCSSYPWKYFDAIVTL